MRSDRNTPARTLLAMLCLALNLVFTASAAASVVDRAQHAAHLPHTHSLQITLLEDDEDHHRAETPTAGHDDGEDRGGRNAPAHHHHGDAPQLVSLGLVWAVDGLASPAAPTWAPPRLIPPSFPRAGLDRPPKAGLEPIA